MARRVDLGAVDRDGRRRHRHGAAVAAGARRRGAAWHVLDRSERLSPARSARTSLSAFPPRRPADVARRANRRARRRGTRARSRSRRRIWWRDGRAGSRRTRVAAGIVVRGPPHRRARDRRAAQRAATARYLVFATVAVALIVPLAVWACLPVTSRQRRPRCRRSSSRRVSRCSRRRSRSAHLLRDRFPMLDGLAQRAESHRGDGRRARSRDVVRDAGRCARERVTYLADPHGADSATRARTPSIAATWRWRAGRPMRVVELREFVKTHPTFWVYALEPNWALRSLREMPLTIAEHVREGAARLTLAAT